MNYKSRSEHYLAYLTGMAPDYPEKPLSRVEWYLDYLCKNGGGGGDIEEIKREIERIKSEIAELQLFKFPNVTIIGTPLIDNGQVSGFSVSNYMQFPFIMDFRSRPFAIDMCFTTDSNVTTQQNIFDSKFGMAFAIINSHFVLAISTTGTNWDLGALTGSHIVQPDTTYYVRLNWDGSKYTIAYSLDAVNYTIDASVDSSMQPAPKTIIIGVGDIDSSHPEPFLGTINLNRAYLSVNGEVFWQGMDDSGIATRLAVDMSNIDDAGKEVVRELATEVVGTLGYVTPEMFGAVGDGVYDDTVAIQNMLNFASGKCRCLLTGKYVIEDDETGTVGLRKENDIIIVPSNTYIEFMCGSKIYVKQKNATYSWAFAFDGSNNVIIKNGVFEGDSNTRNVTHCHCFVFCNNASNILIDNCDISVFNGDCVSFQDGSHDIDIKNCNIHHYARMGITMDWCHDVKITECEIHDSMDVSVKAGIDIESNYKDVASVVNISINGCRFYNNTLYDITMHNVTFDGIKIINCVFNGNVFETGSTTVNVGTMDSYIKYSNVLGIVNVKNFKVEDCTISTLYCFVRGATFCRLNITKSLDVETDDITFIDCIINPEVLRNAKYTSDAITKFERCTIYSNVRISISNLVLDNCILYINKNDWHNNPKCLTTKAINTHVVHKDPARRNLLAGTEKVVAINCFLESENGGNLCSGSVTELIASNCTLSNIAVPSVTGAVMNNIFSI